MVSKSLPLFSVSDFLASLNQTLEYAYPSIEIEGEVASFKVNQGKFVFFDIKDAGGSVGCFMTVWQLRVPIEDGMKVIVRAVPKLTQWGKFSLTVSHVRPSGEGNLKKSFDLLVAKLEKEGLFSSERKRELPTQPKHIGVISSTQAAGYADFIKILSDRWGDIRVDVAHTQVQGEVAPDQMIRAIKFFNEMETPPEVLVIIRGGGSADDLAAFNDELLAREIASSRVPTLVGVGHEIDTTLADMVADVRAATPSNAAQIVVPDKRDITRSIDVRLQTILRRIDVTTTVADEQINRRLIVIIERLDEAHEQYDALLTRNIRVMVAYNPKSVLARGYAIMRGEAVRGETIAIETRKKLITAEVKDVTNK